MQGERRGQRVAPESCLRSLWRDLRSSPRAAPPSLATLLVVACGTHAHLQHEEPLRNDAVHAQPPLRSFVLNSLPSPGPLRPPTNPAKPALPRPPDGGSPKGSVNGGLHPASANRSKAESSSGSRGCSRASAPLATMPLCALLLLLPIRRRWPLSCPVLLLFAGPQRETVWEG